MSIPIDSRTAALWLLDEQHDSVTPSDAAGNLEDLEAHLFEALSLERASEQYAEITDAAQTGLDLTSAFTIEARVRLNSDPSPAMGIVSKIGGSPQSGYFVQRRPGAMFFGIYDSDVQSFLSRSWTASTGTWYRIAVRYDHGIAGSMADAASLFVDGIELTGGSSTAKPANLVDTAVDFQVGLSGGSFPWDGDIRDVKVWGRALSDAEIADDVASTDELRARWILDGAYTDASGNGNTLTPVNSPTFVDGERFRPAVEDSDGIWGRAFTASPATGLEAADTGDDLLLTGEVSLVAVVALDVAGQDTASTPGTIAQRGGDAVAADWGLRVTVEDAGNRLVRLQMFWDDGGGVEVKDQGALFEWGQDEEYLIAAIREIDGTGLTVRYVVNGDALEGGVGHGLSVDSASGATVYLGAAPSYVNHLVGTVSYFEVLDEAIAVEEVIQAWQLFVTDAPRSVTALKSLLPPGPYDKADPVTSTIHGELDIEAAGLARARNLARLRRDYLLPGSAFGDQLEDWETLTGRARFPDDSIDRRQTRVEEYLQRAPGYNTADLQFQLAELLGYEDDPTQADILKYTVDHTQDFSSASSPGAEEAVIDEGNATLTVASAALQFDATTVDLQFDPSSNGAPYHLFSFTASLDLFFGGKLTRNAAPTADDVLVGFMMGERSTNEWLWVGMVFDGADYFVSTIRFTDGEMEASYTTLSSAVNDATLFFRFRHKGSGKYDVQWGTSDALAQAQTPTEVDGPSDPLWAGPAAVAIAASTSIDHSFDDWYSHEQGSEAPVTYHVFRDPADGGNFDAEGAHLLLQAIGPVHFEGYVIGKAQLECDDTDSGCERHPMGV